MLISIAGYSRDVSRQVKSAGDLTLRVGKCRANRWRDSSHRRCEAFEKDTPEGRKRGSDPKGVRRSTMQSQIVAFVLDLTARKRAEKRRANEAYRASATA